MVKEKGFDVSWTAKEKDLLHWRQSHPDPDDDRRTHRKSHVKVGIDIGEELEVKTDGGGQKYLELPFQTTAQCHMYIPDTFSDGNGAGRGRTHLVVFGEVDGIGTWSEKPRDEGSVSKKNIAKLDIGTWNEMETFGFSDPTLHLETGKKYRLWPKRIGFWTNHDDDQFDSPPIQGNGKFDIPMIAKRGEFEEEIDYFILT